jgi:hypothetical protein
MRVHVQLAARARHAYMGTLCDQTPSHTADRAEGDAEAGAGNTVILAAPGTRPARPQRPPICALFGSFPPQLWLTVSRNLSTQDGALDLFSLHGGCPLTAKNGR